MDFLNSPEVKNPINTADPAATGTQNPNQVETLPTTDAVKGTKVNDIEIETDPQTGFITVKDGKNDTSVVVDTSSGNMAWVSKDKEVVAIDSSRGVTAQTDPITGEVKSTDTETCLLYTSPSPRDRG